MKASTELRGEREPFWLDAAKSKMLALVGPDGQAQLLDEKLASVSLTDQERLRVTYETGSFYAGERAIGRRVGSAR